MFIYKITNLENNKCYIGLTTRNVNIRWIEHCKYDNSYLSKSIRKYGSNNFKIEVIDTATSEKELMNKESMWIDKLKTTHPSGYNLTTGGELNKNMSLASRKKMSKSKLGKNNPNYGSNTTAKAIYCKNNDKTYISASEAAKELNLTRSNIARVARGERSHVKGFVFKFVESH